MSSEQTALRRIMIIDDDGDIGESLRCWFEVNGYEVKVFTDGCSALASIALESERSPLDLVLLDLNMPGMDGMTVLHELRMRHREIPVIMMSGTSDPQAIRDAVRAGARDFVQKPMDLRFLREKCDRVLERRGMT